MSNQQRLLESIYDDPRADDARRVYADWLVGRGDPRGEFIHLQLDRFGGRATSEQFARERALLEQHSDAWIRPFYALADHIVFERGFVTRVVLDAPSVARGYPVPPTAWSTVEELFMRDSGQCDVPDALARLVDAPWMAGLCRISAPVAMLEALTKSARRQWSGITVLGRCFMDPLMELCGRLPKLNTVGVPATSARQIRRLCARPRLPARIRRLEVLWWDNAHYTDSAADFFLELVEGSVFDEFRWFNTSSHGEFVLHRTGPGRYGVVEGDAHVIEDLDDPPAPTTFDEVRVYWASDPDPDYYDGVHALAERTGATLEIETLPRVRLLPTPEVERAV